MPRLAIFLPLTPVLYRYILDYMEKYNRKVIQNVNIDVEVREVFRKQAEELGWTFSRYFTRLVEADISRRKRVGRIKELRSKQEIAPLSEEEGTELVVLEATLKGYD